jgi:dCTP deaminase
MSSNATPPRLSLLSDKAILDHMKHDRVRIEPFSMEALNTSSYDVTLGKYYFREATPEAGRGIYNPYSREMVDRVWGTPQTAERCGDWRKRTGSVLENISDDDLIIWLKPGETILGHTNEFIGGRER